MILKREENNEAIENFSAQLEVEGRSLWQDARIRFMRNKAAMTSLFILLCITAWVLIGPMFATYAFDDTDWYAMHAAPSLAEDGHIFGTDALGRDIYVRT